MRLNDDGTAIDLLDENGLKPTTGARAIIASVLMALDDTDEKWSGRNKPGVPSVTDYAETVAEMMKRRWLNR